MITGVVTAARHPVVRVRIEEPGGRSVEIEALVDTGFNGELTLPLATVEALGLEWLRSGRALLADGSDVLFDSYEAIIEWDGVMRSVTVDSADTDPLIGMTLLDGYELTIQAVVGGTVTIEPLSTASARAP